MIVIMKKKRIAAVRMIMQNDGGCKICKNTSLKNGCRGYENDKLSHVLKNDSDCLSYEEIFWLPCCEIEQGTELISKELVK